MANDKTTMRQAALTAGFGLLIMAIAASFAQMYAMPKLIVSGNMTETIHNIMDGRALFLGALFCYLVAFICDVFVAWGFYVLLAPVNRSFSLLTAWFRLMYTAIALYALINLFMVDKMLGSSQFLEMIGPNHWQVQVVLSLSRFNNTWSFGFFFFSIHLLLLGYLVYRSGTIPRLIGILLAVAGLGYLADTLRPFFFPGLSPKIVMVTFIGELVFMVWLLVKGWKLKEQG